VRIGIRKRLRIGILAGLAVAVGGVTLATLPAHAGTGSSHCGHVVYGAIEDKYAELGAEGGPLGCPTNDESDAARGGRWEQFQNGYIFWHPNLGAWSVQGAIAQKWTEYGRENGLGYPLTDETTAPDGVGRFNHFENQASIYWTPATGAHMVMGGIRQKWADLNWETTVGYPTTDEQDMPGGRVSHFQHGQISWTQQGGASLDFLSFDTGGLNLNGPPVGGSAHLQVFKNGAFTFSGHFHDSGFTSYNVSFVWALRLTDGPDGVLIRLFDKGHVQGTLGAGSRDYDWNQSGKSDAIAAAWPSIDNGLLSSWHAEASWDVSRIFSDLLSGMGFVGKVIEIGGKLT
jgi:hypothetical protein